MVEILAELPSRSSKAKSSSTFENTMRRREITSHRRRYVASEYSTVHIPNPDTPFQGISLTVDQYKALLEVLPKLNTHLKGMNIDVSTTAVPDEESEEEEKPKKRVKAKKQEKANIEATSDEDDE